MKRPRNNDAVPRLGLFPLPHLMDAVLANDEQTLRYYITIYKRYYITIYKRDISLHMSTHGFCGGTFRARDNSSRVFTYVTGPQNGSFTLKAELHPFRTVYISLTHLEAFIIM